ncbi:MAG: hypothetical protein AUH29_04150 [Candidatus Rokubacteria bacterium 13_1_40CM_69_27]|nr:MAG: hypothetical protein AUH29_04150 [Candidatus Rokubacteria bacterium 13_1_40CM_69_27]
MLLLVVVPAYVATQRAPAEDSADLLDGGPVDQATDLDAAPDAPVIHAHIREVAARYGVSVKLVVAVISVESEFNPRAVSRRGARGLMQLMPATASSLSVDDSFDPLVNIEAGVRHLRRLMDRFDNDLPLVLAAYNAGERAVIVHGGIPPYRETRKYVVRVLQRVDPDLARAFLQEYARRQASPDRGRGRSSRATGTDDPAASAKPISLDARAATDGGFLFRPPPRGREDRPSDAQPPVTGRAAPQSP